MVGSLALPMVAVRTGGDPLAVVPFLAEAVTEAHPRAALGAVMTMADRLPSVVVDREPTKLLFQLGKPPRRLDTEALEEEEEDPQGRAPRGSSRRARRWTWAALCRSRRLRSPRPAPVRGRCVYHASIRAARSSVPTRSSTTGRVRRFEPMRNPRTGACWSSSGSRSRRQGGRARLSSAGSRQSA